MVTKLQEKTKKEFDQEHLEKKAAILDELVDFIEDKYLGLLMNSTENEENIPLEKAKGLLHA